MGLNMGPTVQMLVSFKSLNIMRSMAAIRFGFIIIISGLNDSPCPVNERAPVDRLKDLLLLFPLIGIRVKML
jgi:hypothetical protein